LQGRLGASATRSTRNRGPPRARRVAARAHGSGGAGLAAGDTGAGTRTLQQPAVACFQVLKRHFARYTPEIVPAVVRGCRRACFTRVCELVDRETRGPRPDPPRSSLQRRLGTQHTVGVQYIRTAAILQALLGQHRSAGAGASWRLRRAHRLHPGIHRHSHPVRTCCPGNLPMPHAPHQRGPRRLREGRVGGKKGFLGQTCAAYNREAC